MAAPSNRFPDQAERLGSEPVLSLIWKFSLPSIIGTLVFASTNIVNTIFIGRAVGPSALAAISLSFPIFAIFMALGMLVGIGSGALVSIRLGEGRHDVAERILGNCFFLFVLISLVLAVLGQLFLTPILRTFGASDVVLPYAKTYLRIILLTPLFNALAMGLNNIIRAEGNPKLAMLTMLIGATANVALNALFVMHLHWGIAGAAWATFFSTGISAIWTLSHFMTGRGGLRLRLSNLGFDPALMKPALFIGLSPCLMQILSSMVAVIANRALSHHGGDTAVAAIAIINSVAMVVVFPIIGLTQGVQPILGFNFGAGKPDRVRKALGLAIVFASVVAVLGWLVTHLFPTAIIHIFSRGDPTLLADGKRGLTLFLGLFFLVGFQAVSANYFQAVGKPGKAIFLNVLRQGFLLIPLLLILPRYYGLDGIWFAAPVSDLLAFIITAVFITREFRTLSQEAKPAAL